MSFRRKIFIGIPAFVIFVLLLEVNSRGDRLLQAATRHAARFARRALDALIANS